MKPLQKMNVLQSLKGAAPPESPSFRAEYVVEYIQERKMAYHPSTNRGGGRPAHHENLD